MPDAPTAGTSCIFCKIIAGDIPCHKLYEDEHVLSFLDIGPLSEGHALIIPKDHFETIDQVPPKVAAAMGRIVPALSKAIMQATGAKAWNLLQNNGEAAGQAVNHVHLHIIPRPAGDARDEPIKGNGLPFKWPPGEVDQESAANLAERVISELNQ